VDGRVMAQKALQDAHSARLSKIVALLQAENPFDGVLDEIDKMVELIGEEGKADAEKLSWCNKERTENNAALKKANKGILSLEKEINGLENDIDNEKTGLKAQIAKTETSLSENVASQKEQTTERTADNLNYQADVKNSVAAQVILAKAIKALKTYYDSMEQKLADGMNAFVQEDPTPPQALGDDKYEGQSTQGNAVLKMLNFILDETKSEETAAHADEEKAQADYEDTMTLAKKQEAGDEKRLSDLQETLAEKQESLLKANEDLKATTEDRDATKDYLAKIKPGCDFITSNFDQREKNRATEKAALIKAIGLIKATPAYKTAVTSATNESYGDCKTCEKDADDVECKACMADVTIPAYCAGHKGIKGC